jgi:hypothetical protein
MSLRVRDHALSLDYLRDMDDARRLVDELVAIGWPLPRIVWRARTLYRAIHRREVLRHRSGDAIPD